VDWFKSAIVFALGVIAFSVFYRFVIIAPAPEKSKIGSELQDRAKIGELNNAIEDTPERSIKESAPFRDEKAARELEQAQIEFERQIREEEAAARVRQEEENRQRETVARSLASQNALNQCVAQADAEYRASWNRDCAANGRPVGCFLPVPVAANLEQTRRGFRDECFKRYSKQ